MMEPVSARYGRVLEDAFFAHQDELALAALRRTEEERSRRAALAAASGIADPAVLDALETHGIEAPTLAALALAPLVLVAWADGSLDGRERAALRQAVGEAGLAAGSPAAALLERWLAAPPGPRLAEAWHAYAHGLAAALPPASRAALRHETIGRARRVAAASGGFLGLGHAVSAAEERVLAALEAAFG